MAATWLARKPALNVVNAVSSSRSTAAGSGTLAGGCRRARARPGPRSSAGQRPGGPRRRKPSHFCPAVQAPTGHPREGPRARRCARGPRPGQGTRQRRGPHATVTAQPIGNPAPQPRRARRDGHRAARTAGRGNARSPPGAPRARPRRATTPRRQAPPRQSAAAMRNAQYRDSTPERSRPCPRSQAGAGTTPPGTAHARATRRDPGASCAARPRMYRSHPMTAPPPQRRSRQGAPPLPLRRVMPVRLVRVMPTGRRVAVRRLVAHRLSQMLIPLTRNADVPCLPAKAIHGTPAFREYHISPGFFMRLSWPLTGRAGSSHLRALVGERCRPDARSAPAATSRAQVAELPIRHGSPRHAMLIAHPRQCRSVDALSAANEKTTRRLDESFMYA